MNDKDLEQINTVDVTITAESIDAHVICLRENGYKIFKSFSLYTRYILFFLLGATLMGTML
tara:strand:+ start:267 stop:449 length:183 start_codon:yes stop_codon:yes gene_type:complete